MIADLVETAIAAARSAGELQQDARSGTFHVESKGHADITTEVDVASERTIARIVRERFETHGFLGEEGARERGTSDYSWIVDPLDGTKNFARGHVRCGVSIAVAKAGVVHVAVVHAPFTNETFVGVRGRGATCNDAPIRVAPTSELSSAMVASAFSFRGTNIDRPQARRLAGLFPSVRALRSTGCAALDLCDVARGRFDAYFEPTLPAWDTAAGTLIVEESGGRVSSIDGATHVPGETSVLATNGAIHGEIVAALRRGEALELEVEGARA